MGNPGSLRGSIPNCNKGSQQKQSQRMKPRKLDHGPSELTSALKVSQRWRTMTKFPWWRRTWHFAGQGSKRIEKNADKFSIFYPSNDNTPMIVTNHSPTGFWQWSPRCQKRKVCVLGLLGNVGFRFFWASLRYPGRANPSETTKLLMRIPQLCILSLGGSKFQRNKYVGGSSN